MRLRALGRAVLQGVAILLISLALSEAALRVYDYFHPLFIFYDESYNRFRPRPHGNDWGFQLNSGGFKDPEFGAKPKGAYRILGIGDSFAFGVVPYRYAYLTLLEEDLKRQNPAVELLNLGIPGMGPREYLALLVREGLALEPDAVLLSFFVGNDFQESRRKARPLYTYSHVISLIQYLFRVLPKYEGWVKKRTTRESDYCDDCPNFNKSAYLGLVAGRSAIYIDWNRDFFQLLEDAVYYLVEIQKICARKGIALVVVVIPDEVQVNAELQREVREGFFPGQPWNTTRPNEALVARLKELGIQTLDLYPDFTAAAGNPGAALYRPRDSHWNIRGNRLAADVIGRELPRWIHPPRP